MKKLLTFCLACLLAFTAWGDGKAAQGEDIRSRQGPDLSLQGLPSVYLPVVRQRYPTINTFGVEVTSGHEKNLSEVSTLGMTWVRTDILEWDEVEPNRTDPPTYKWKKDIDKFFESAAAQSINLVVNIRHTPSWAQKYPGYSCGPMSAEYIPAYVQFLQAAVSRYSAAPYKIRYWELANEPDIDHIYVAQDAPYGCWGEEGDEYYGGAYYAEVLKSAYPAIKTIDPKARVLFGGLSLECDPTNPPPNKTCKSTKFFEGALRAGAGPYFDIVSFHGYNQYWGSLWLDEHYPGWDVRGGVVLGKINYLRYVLAQYGYQKDLINTEGALLCSERSPDWCNPPGDAFFEKQADYAVWLYVRNLAVDIKATIWYEYEGPGWRYSGILDRSNKPKPVYDAIKFLSKELTWTSFQRQITQFEGLKAYEFGAATKRIWVMWAPDEKPHTITIPGTILKVLDKYGRNITFQNNVLTISSPVYVELKP